MNQRKRGRPQKKPNKATFDMIYYNNSMTIHEIAEFFGVSIYTVYKWASDFRKEEEKIL